LNTWFAVIVVLFCYEVSDKISNDAGFGTIVHIFCNKVSSEVSCESPRSFRQAPCEQVFSFCFDEAKASYFLFNEAKMGFAAKLDIIAGLIAKTG
jgi:hypothetical protein